MGFKDLQTLKNRKKLVMLILIKTINNKIYLLIVNAINFLTIQAAKHHQIELRMKKRKKMKRMKT